MNPDQTHTIDTIRTKLNNLKTLLDFPKYFLSSYFGDLKHDVDCTFAQLTCTALDDSKRFELRKAWTETIRKIETFELDCFRNLNVNSKLDEQQRDELNAKIKRFERKLAKSTKKLDKYADLIDLELIQLERNLFLNRTVIFMDVKKCKETSLFNEFFLSKLTFITDEYLSRQGVETILNK